MGQALVISPLKASQGDVLVGPKTLQDIVGQIDNQKDFNNYIISKEKDPGAVSKKQVEYDRHPVSIPPISWRSNPAPFILIIHV